VLDVMLERVLEALDVHGTPHADALGGLDAETVGRKEFGRGRATAAGVEHPLVFLRNVVHRHLLSDGAYGSAVTEVRHKACPVGSFSKLPDV
jgi:hypothetical protein